MQFASTLNDTLHITDQFDLSLTRVVTNQTQSMSSSGPKSSSIPPPSFTLQARRTVGNSSPPNPSKPICRPLATPSQNTTAHGKVLMFSFSTKNGAFSALSLTNLLPKNFLAHLDKCISKILHRSNLF